MVRIPHRKFQVGEKGILSPTSSEAPMSEFLLKTFFLQKMFSCSADATLELPQSDSMHPIM